MGFGCCYEQIEDRQEANQGQWLLDFFLRPYLPASAD